MNKSNEPKNPSTLNRRIVTFTQRRGGLGKRLLSETLICWGSFADVTLAGIDADKENKTLSNRFPGRVMFFEATKDKNNFSLMLDALPQVPLVVLDIPSNATNNILEAFAHLQVLDTWDAHGTRATVILFADNDPEAFKSADATLRNLGPRVDYVMVDNHGSKRGSNKFKASTLCKQLADLGTPTLTMPTLTDATMNAWGVAQAKTKRHLNLDEVRNTDGLSPYNRQELEYFRNVMFSQFEDIAGRLLPDPKLIQNRTVGLRAVQPLVEASDESFNFV